MSSFLSGRRKNLTPYTPGEQPQDRSYVKLNTNESPYPPSENAVRLAKEEAERLELYSDPECRKLVKTAAEYFGVEEDEILFTNGSDEILNFAFMAFCDEAHPAVFPDITYGFYPVFAELNAVPYEEIPLTDDLRVDVRQYCGIGKTVFLANPNAPTGLALPLSDIEEIVRSNPGNVVVIDEAYVDFGAESAVSLVKKYGNLLVAQTFSKSRSMAGARLGFGIAQKELIRDLNTIKYATNPYNVNRMTMAAGIGALLDDAYTKENCRKIEETRAYAEKRLSKLGFSFPDSKSNFIFAKHESISGQRIYGRLKEKGVLVRHFTKERIKDYNRITVGTPEQMDVLFEKLAEILEEET